MLVYSAVTHGQAALWLSGDQCGLFVLRYFPLQKTLFGRDPDTALEQGIGWLKY